MDADKNQFVLTDKDGKDLTFKMDDNAKIRLNDKDSKLNDLKEGDEITVTYEKKGDRMIASEVRCERKWQRPGPLSKSEIGTVFDNRRRA